MKKSHLVSRFDHPGGLMNCWYFLLSPRSVIPSSFYSVPLPVPIIFAGALVMMMGPEPFLRIRRINIYADGRRPFYPAGCISMGKNDHLENPWRTIQVEIKPCLVRALRDRSVQFTWGGGILEPPCFIKSNAGTVGWNSTGKPEKQTVDICLQRLSF